MVICCDETCGIPGYVLVVVAQMGLSALLRDDVEADIYVQVQVGQTRCVHIGEMKTKGF